MGLAVIGLANYKFVERTTLDVGASINGDIALLHAQSAVEEAIYITGKEIDPAQAPNYLRKFMSSDSWVYSKTISVPELADILNEESNGRYELVDGKVNANVLLQRSFGNLLYEKYGTINSGEGQS